VGWSTYQERPIETTENDCGGGGGGWWWCTANVLAIVLVCSSLFFFVVLLRCSFSLLFFVVVLRWCSSLVFFVGVFLFFCTAPFGEQWTAVLCNLLFISPPPNGRNNGERSISSEGYVLRLSTPLYASLRLSTPLYASPMGT
jgi:hypothetical protein